MHTISGQVRTCPDLDLADCSVKLMGQGLEIDDNVAHTPARTQFACIAYNSRMYVLELKN